MKDITFGIVSVVIGLLLLTPPARRYYRGSRDRLYRMMPWLQRIPGVRVIYSDPVQAVVLSVVGVGFLVIGLVMVFGLVHLR